MTSKAHIDTVNYEDFVSDDPDRKLYFIAHLGNSLSEIRFVLLSNHGVKEALRNELFSASKKFFELPDEVKFKYEFPELAGQRGYIGKFKETAKGFKTPDMKEFYHIGQTIQNSIGPDYAPNIWPEEVPELKEVSLCIYKIFEETGRKLLQAIALYLGLSEIFFNKKIHAGNSILRLLHYFPVIDISKLPVGSVRAAAHEDINLITLLMGGSAQELQAQTKAGKWIDVNPLSDQIVVNIGDMIQRLTNGQLVSTSHRVINKNPLLMKKSRYSAPFFLHPVPSMDLTALPSTINQQQPKKFQDMTAGKYLNERLKQLGLK
jgi:isopenicillin N synthase-like dioxygenase